MTRKTHILSLPALLAVLVLSCACAKIIQPDPEYGTDGISFSATTVLPEGWQPLTKAVNVDLDYLKDDSRGKGFGVFAYYTQSANYEGPASNVQVVLSDRQVKFARDYSYDMATNSWTALGSASDKAWVYYGQNFYGSGQDAYKEYWPMKDGEKMTFFAYAPYNLWNSTDGTAGAGNRVTFTAGAVPTIPYTLFKSGNTGVAVSGSNYTVTVQDATFANGIQKDVLWGVQSTGYTYKNFTRPSVTTDEHEENTVKFHFRHALSKLRFKIIADDVPQNPTLAAISSSSGNSDSYATETTSNPMRTFYLIESISVESNNTNESEDVLKNSGILYLDNTSADTPNWDSREGNIKYVLSENYLNSATVLYKKGSSASTSNTIARQNRDNYADILSAFKTAKNGGNLDSFGVTTTAKDLFKGNYLYAIPGTGKLTVKVKYHKITFYYHNRTSGSSTSNDRFQDYTVYDKADVAKQELTGTMQVNLEGGRAYDISIILPSEGPSSKLDLVLQVQPWEMSEFSYEYTNRDYSVIEHLTFDSDYIDYRIDDKVYINNRMGKFTFRVDGGKYLYWRASLIGDNAFAFTDKFGNYLTDTSGELLTMLPGTLDKDVSNEIYIKALNTSSTVFSKARLRLYFYTGEGEAVVPLNLVNLKCANGDPILEWTVVQNAN